jgi:hypothetical protein
MNVLVLPIHEIKNENIFFLDHKKNILMDGIFTKLIFTNEWFTMNGIYINLPIQVKNIESNPMMGQKYTISFCVNTHLELIDKIENLEKSILEKYHQESSPDSTKVPTYNLQYSLHMGKFKIFKENKILHKHTEFSLKISGIWENAKTFGLSYKIMDSVNVV